MGDFLLLKPVVAIPFHEDFGGAGVNFLIIGVMCANDDGVPANIGGQSEKVVLLHGAGNHDFIGVTDRYQSNTEDQTKEDGLLGFHEQLLHAQMLKSRGCCMHCQSTSAHRIKFQI